MSSRSDKQVEGSIESFRCCSDEQVDGPIKSFRWNGDYRDDGDSRPWQAVLRMPGVGTIMSRLGDTRGQAVASLKAAIPQCLQQAREQALRAADKIHFLEGLIDPAQRA